MKFGQVENPNDIEFSLPENHPANNRILQKGSGKGQLYLGCSKWTNDGFIGSILPDDTKKKDLLNAYSHAMNTVELNATHYRIFPESTFLGWKEKVAPGFKFCPKFPQFISHIKRLNDVEPMTDRFLASVNLLDDKLGPCFLQMHKSFGPKDMERLNTYLSALPEDFKMFLEVRDPAWFEDGALNELCALLVTLKKGLVLTDSSGRRDCVHGRLTLPEVFIRFVGNSGHKTDRIRMEQWAERLSEWRTDGLEDIWFFIHQHDDKSIGELGLYLIHQLNAIGKMEIPTPEFASRYEPVN